MSMLPRRTNELASAPNTKQERLSRIAQPTTRTSRERSTRSTSLDKLGNHLNAYVTSSKRSISATPLRTPSRGGRLGENSTILLTSEKERYPDDKKIIHEKAIKISEYVEKHVTSLKDGFSFHGNGLRTMSTKQFATIVNHLLNHIGGNRLSIGGNYVDTMPKILTEIGYPYSVNKSWLKTPTAPHAYHNIVTLLDWLLLFALNKNNEENGEEIDYEYILPGKNFPDKKSTWSFLLQEQKAFVLWNNLNEDEYENLKRNITDNLISMKTGLKGLSALEREIAKIKVEVKEILDNRMTISDEKKYLNLDKDIKDKQKMLKSYEKECKEKLECLKVLEEDCKNKLETLNAIKKKIEEYNNTIKHQEMSIQKRNDLISEISYLKEYLNALKKSVSELQDLGCKNQITFARLLKKIVEVIATFNSFIHKIFSSAENLQSINVGHMILDRNSNESIIDQLNRIVPILQNLKEKNLEESKRCKEEIRILKKQLEQHVYEYNELLKEEYSNLNEKCKETDLKIQQVDNQSFEMSVQAKKEITLMENNLNVLRKKNDEISSRIQQNKINLEKLKKENEEILKEITIKADVILTAKEQFVNKLDEALNQFSGTIDKVEKSIRDEKNNQK